MSLKHLQLLKKVKNNLKKDQVFIDNCKKFNIDPKELDFYPMSFKELPVTARTDKCVIYFNTKLLDEENPEEAILPYMLHEVIHVFQQSTGTKPTKSSANRDDYLDNSNEVEAFQQQIRHVSKNSGKGEAKKYVDKLLDHHDVGGKERKEKEETLLKDAGAIKQLEVDRFGDIKQLWNNEVPIMADDCEHLAAKITQQISKFLPTNAIVKCHATKNGPVVVIGIKKSNSTKLTSLNITSDRMKLLTAWNKITELWKSWNPGNMELSEKSDNMILKFNLYPKQWVNLTKAANIRSEMAKRIMHSVIPGLASQEEVSATKGVVDYKSLAAAIEGRKDIIKYGTEACAEELEHYDWKSERSVKLSQDTLSLAINGKYKEALLISIKSFDDTTKWQRGFGGSAWAKIAKTLLKLVELDEQLTLVRSNKKDPAYVDAEIGVMNEILVYLNIFDGLAHNSDSIMRNLVTLEAAELTTGDPLDTPKQLKDKYMYRGKYFEDEMKKIKRLMDAKELKNVVDVYKEVEKTLQDSGDINRYPDWVTKAKGHPDYRNDNSKEKELELFKINLRKDLIKRKERFNVYFNRALNDYKDLSNALLSKTTETSTLYHEQECEEFASKLIGSYDNLASTIMSFTSNIMDHLDAMANSDFEYKNYISDGMNNILSSLNTIYDKYKTYITNIKTPIDMSDVWNDKVSRQDFLSEISKLLAVAQEFQEEIESI